ncbi:Cilia- and flagella-associated protein 45 [Rhizophlyctis rosea]|uniref:Cilia- and flagella-associated protein 45 n=1 Tax=Rhizophlyctis rosea TaxID=64517 RepID=A0AAD5WZJ0_9FUNG|nr:Cilia- and flagella-associated protein 45 [Rhizophlyctis rosea]
MRGNDGGVAIAHTHRGGVAHPRPHIHDRQAARKAASTPRKNGRGKEKEKLITVITRDNIRTLRPHPDDMPRELGTRPGVWFDQPSKSGARPLVVGAGELERVKATSHYMTPAELDHYNRTLNAQRIAAAEASKARKELMEHHDHLRASTQKLSTYDQEAKQKSNYLLAKAQLQLEEQEDEIKHMNELMLYAKCVAIRDAQVEEKQQIKTQRHQEDARLDAMMECERVAELKRLEEREKKRIEQLRRGAAKIREQIEERREAALLEQERRDQETKGILKQIADMNEQDKAEKAAKVKAQKGLMQEVVKANQDSTSRKRLQKLAEEEEDRKVMEYLLEKEKIAIENDRIASERKAEREKELARLRAAQEKMSDKQAAQDALRAQRAAEAYEREWRLKEKVTAERQAKQEQDLREDRARQQRAREHAIAVEAHKMREEFYENLARQKEMEEKLKREAEEKERRNRIYAQEVKSQILEKESHRLKARQDFFMEGVKQAVERADKIKKIDGIKHRKLQELRGLGVPEKYCKEIERQVHVEHRTFSNP